jgi:hypothetical protein
VTDAASIYAPRVVGKLFALGEEVPFVHPAVWMREATNGPERLRVGGGDHSTRTLLALAGELPEPLFVLVVMRVPRAGEEGRWESEAMMHTEVAVFVDEFRDLFEKDARADLWVGTTTNQGLVVLDEHDLIYAYGPLDRFEGVLRSDGYVAGEPRAPDPHEHHYNVEFDDLEMRIREWHAWRRLLPPS